MKEYDPKTIESKWQKIWEESGIYKAENDSQKPKWYSLIEFPYPSGDGLHVGHPRPYIGMDIVSRKRRMQGHNVLYPIGWDAFGLPTENYAIKTGRKPADITRENSDTFRRQIKSLGISFDWSREVNTTDPKYYKWTQWLFLEFFKQGLAYKARQEINWCPKDKIGLANEEVIDGKCERCGTSVERREKEQWMLAITKYAERLDKDLDTVDFAPRIKAQQKNWIGKSEGAEIDFELIFLKDPKVNDNRGPNGEKAALKVFTTRPETIFGATYLVLAPEHLWVKLATDDKHDVLENKDEVKKYLETVKKRSEVERTAEGKEKTGVELKGVKAINPATKEEIPIWVADYVLPNYGTGAIMAVPAHDERDNEFAKKFNLNIRTVVLPTYVGSGTKSWMSEYKITNEDGLLEVIKESVNTGASVYSHRGTLLNSGRFDGMTSDEAFEKILEFVEGKKKTTFKLRDWIFSRQRYWGEPIPMIYCEKDGWVPVPESDLPVLLPEIEKYQPTDSGESPLANISEWVNTTCPKCGGGARRETDTMPNWAGSSWYFLAYCMSDFDKPASLENWKLQTENFRHFMPVDWYNGGMEHTTLHLLYSRFWNKFLFDQGLVPTSEPYKKRTSHGLILAEGGEKMSKSKGNVVNPDKIVESFGADTLRLYEMFMGPFEQAIAWSEASLVGPRRFVEKVWRLQTKVSENAPLNPESEYELNGAIKKVSEDIETLGFNTAVSTLMSWVNSLDDHLEISKFEYEILLKLLSPFAPHVTEELWEIIGHKGSIHTDPWPTFDEAKLVQNETLIALQVNGKVRATVMVPSMSSEAELENMALNRPEIAKWLEGKKVVKVIVIPGRVVNIVTT